MSNYYVSSWSLFWLCNVCYQHGLADIYGRGQKIIPERIHVMQEKVASYLNTVLHHRTPAPHALLVAVLAGSGQQPCFFRFLYATLQKINDSEDVFFTKRKYPATAASHSEACKRAWTMTISTHHGQHAGRCIARLWRPAEGKLSRDENSSGFRRSVQDCSHLVSLQRYRFLYRKWGVDRMK